MKTEMTLKELVIKKRASYEDMAGRFVAEVSYEGSQGEITIPLMPEISEKLLVFLAPLLARFGSDAAKEIAASVLNVIEDQKSIELPENASVAQAP